MIKPGYQTSELYVTIAGMIVAALAGLGIVKPANATAAQQITLSIILAIAPLGYTALRTWLKTYAPTLPTLPDALLPTPIVSAASLLPTDLANSMQWHDSNVMPVTPFLGRPVPEIIIAPPVVTP